MGINVKATGKLPGSDILPAAVAVPSAAAQHAVLPDAPTPPSLPPEGHALPPHISARIAVEHKDRESEGDLQYSTAAIGPGSNYPSKIQTRNREYSP